MPSSARVRRWKATGHRGFPLDREVSSGRSATCGLIVLTLIAGALTEPHKNATLGNLQSKHQGLHFLPPGMPLQSRPDLAQ